ncbi:MAG: DUF5615 family PIN-like protein [Anaerolineales bacterium]
MSDLKLHLDADASYKLLHRALLDRGHNVTRTPTEWMPKGASDERQLLGASAHGRCIFTFNIQDFMVLAKHHPRHASIILTVQSYWSLSDLIQALDDLMQESRAEEWVGQVHWLNQWR